MDVRIQAQGLKLTDALERYIRERLDRMDKFQTRVIDSRFELRSINQRNGGEIIAAQFTIQAPGQILRSEARERDERLAIDQAINKMKRQIRRYHSRQISRARNQSTNLGRLAAEQSEVFNEFGVDGEIESPTVVRTKRFELKPMSTDEAIEQMELLEHDFYLFRNREDGETNVIYRRQDGDYGLIAPEGGQTGQ